jgi:hypothetical protein
VKLVVCWVEWDGRRTALQNPVLRFQGVLPGSAEVVYDLLAGLQSHLERYSSRHRRAAAGKPGRHPWLCTAVHRYVIAPEAVGLPSGRRHRPASSAACLDRA